MVLHKPNHHLGLMSRLHPFLMCTYATYIISPKHRQNDQVMYDDNDECIKACTQDWSISTPTDSNCSSIAMQWRSVTQNQTLLMRQVHVQHALWTKNTNTPSEMKRCVLLLEDWGTWCGSDERDVNYRRQTKLTTESNHLDVVAVETEERCSFAFIHQMVADTHKWKWSSCRVPFCPSIPQNHHFKRIWDFFRINLHDMWRLKIVSFLF